MSPRVKFDLKSMYFSLCFLRWNTFGSISAIPPTDGQTDRQELVDRAMEQQTHYISFNGLLMKSERDAPPPPYDAPPPYHVAEAIWGCPSTIVSEPVLV